MAHQIDGWPLGLQPLHVRVRLMENHVLTEANAFNTLIAVSPSFSSPSSSDLDTVSTASFFYDKSITLGNLIGLPHDLEVLSTRVDVQDLRNRRSRHKNFKSSFCCCLPPRTEAQHFDHPAASQSLGHFLEVERRARACNRRDNLFINLMYEEFTTNPSIVRTNPLFSDGQVLPPRMEDLSNNVHREPAGPTCSWSTLFFGTPQPLVDTQPLLSPPEEIGAQVASSNGCHTESQTQQCSSRAVTPWDALTLAKQAVVASKEAAALLSDTGNLASHVEDPVTLSVVTEEFHFNNNTMEEKRTLRSNRHSERQSRMRKLPHKIPSLFPEKHVKVKNRKGVDPDNLLRLFLWSTETTELLSAKEESEHFGRVQDLTRLEELKRQLHLDTGHEHVEIRPRPLETRINTK